MQFRVSYATEARNEIAAPSPSTRTVPLGTGSITACVEVAVACRVLVAFPAPHPSPTSHSHRGTHRAATQAGRAFLLHVMVPRFHPHTSSRGSVTCFCSRRQLAKPQNCHRVQENLPPKKTNVFCALSEPPTAKQIWAQLGPTTALFLKNTSLQSNPSWPS